MSLFQPKQINLPLIAYLGLSGFVSGTAATDILTSALSTAVSTASNSGGAVPLQAGNPSQLTPVEGVALAAANDYLPIFASGTKQLLQDAKGNDVFGTLALAAGVYTVSYWSNIAGVKTAYTFVTATTLDFEVPYVFFLADLPSDALIAIRERHVGPDVGASTRIQVDILTVTALNTVSNLSRLPSGSLVLYYVNGQVVDAKNPGSGISIAGQIATVAPVTLGYNLAVTDTVEAMYTY